MTKFGYALLAVLLIVLIPACATTEVEKVIAVEQGELKLAPTPDPEIVSPYAPGAQVLVVTVYCHDTPLARKLMHRIISRMDPILYRTLMGDPKSPCEDRKHEMKPPIKVEGTKLIGKPFRTVRGLCMQFLGFKDIAGDPGFTWTPIPKSNCGQET